MKEKAIFVVGLFLTVISAVSILGCSQKNTKTTEREDWSSDEKVSWIGDNKPQPAFDSLFYENDPSPIFRKEFKLEKTIKSARLLITAAGYYEATINGKRVGKNRLDPAWTDFSKRIYYSEYDVTQLLAQKENCLGVTLGNGFYNPLPLRMWGNRNLRKTLPVGRPVFTAKMIIEYEDGKTDQFVTDESWKFAYGPIQKNNVYIGEVYDARNEIQGWNSPGFDDAEWLDAVIKEEPGGKLEKAFFPPIQITQRLTPTSIYSSSPGVCIADMGVNFTGTFRMRISGDTGDSIVFRFGERIYPDGSLNPKTTVCGQIKRPGVGGPGAPDVAWQTDTYVIGEKTKAWFQPEFTFHTYRYIEISGLKSKPELSDIEGLAMNTNVSAENSFSCSNKLLNSIQKASERTFLANLQSVQSDCPAREKFGYGGDLNATSETFIYNFDMNSFYRKTIYDWVDAINDSVFIDTAPFVGINYCGLSWESAFLTTQYYLLLYYNNVDLVKELYDFDKKWMEKVARIHPNGIVDSGLSDHESLEPVPVELTGTCHYLFCAQIMQRFAALTGNSADEKMYQELEQKLKKSIKERFWNTPVEEGINKQTLFASLLYFDVLSEEENIAAADSLLIAIKKEPAGHFITGIFGTKYILEALSKYVSPNHVFEIVNSKKYPGWGFMIDKGATTIWETWKESDNTYSNCHPMFGTVSEWFYRWLGGIEPDKDFPGFKKFKLHPSVPENLDSVKCSYQSPFGKIVSNWKKETDKTIYNFRIPNGTTAFVNLPTSGKSVTIQKEEDSDFSSAEVKGLQTGKFDLTEGSYTVVID
ncbi:family 78 glycoside hydrolase catalytic domain [Maribellus maritimus]|uniref:family 78 glycoside hydrolase catalytic domain n=1 Tax=Maribellus maritimus TaxID=2870838 RepID=UPI001EECD42A|nr:family 78 glycoside hydrolase catalytic domain [Maribellus maritimus]MCG6187335.1 glycoside hydrolase family 78 protein [Maribellus maritimus]